MTLNVPEGVKTVPYTCYMCDGPAVSDEHVPAACFFPESKDLPLGVNLRRNLFKVPSCEVHNSAKSHDDQYLWQIILMTQGLNECGQRMVRTKVVRTITRRPALSRSIMSTGIAAYQYDFDIGRWFATTQVQFDGPRLRRTLDQFARALYFWHFKATWPGRVGIFESFARFGGTDRDRDFMTLWRRIIRNAAESMASLPRLGDNQDAFYYQVMPSDGTPGRILLATFYGSATITCGFLDP